MKRALFALCVGLVTIALYAENFKIDPSKRLHRHGGWGVSLCWWAGQCGRWDDEKVDRLVEWITSKEGLNYSVFRYNIPGGDDPENRHCDPHHMAKGKGLRAEMEGFLTQQGRNYDWQADAAQRRVMLKLRQARPDAIFEAFSNTPPYFMTVSGCAAGHDNPARDNLKRECYHAFADYLIDVCLHYKKQYGLTFYSLEPFNEPMTSYWNRNGSQEGCHFDVASMIEFVKVLSPKLKAAKLKTRLAVTDETSVKQSVEALSQFCADPSVLKMVDQWNTHTYSADEASRKTLRALATKAKLPLWMSETGSGGRGIEGNLSLSQRLLDDVKQMQPDVWCDWQVMEENNDQWCTIQGKFDGSDFRRNKNYYVRRQVTGFINAGDTFLDAGDDHSLVAISKDKRHLILVSQNNTAADRPYSVDLTSFRRIGTAAKAYLTDIHHDCEAIDPVPIHNHTLQYTLRPQSICTFIIPLKSTK